MSCLINPSNSFNFFPVGLSSKVFKYAGDVANRGALDHDEARSRRVDHIDARTTDHIKMHVAF